MQGTITYLILTEHLREGVIEPSNEIGVQIDQTFTQDATGTIAYLQFMALGLDRIQTNLSVSYVDHNTLQIGFENADDHLFLQSVAARYGIYFSKPGNGICHQVHLERFGVPGETLLGSDSHTPTAGALGMLGIGAGGLDVAIAMAGGPFFITVPEVFCINLKGKLQPWVNAKDVILTILCKLSVTGGVGKIIEYSGDGIPSLSVPQRATIANMGVELGATSSIFPSDENTRGFLQAQGRSKDWRPIIAEKDAEYEGMMDVDMSEVVPSVACPHSPDMVKPVEEVAGTPIDQVVIGSCTNSSLRDLMTVAGILKGKKIHSDVSLVIAPCSRQVLTALAMSGALVDIISAGGRILECACGPCIGMGSTPPSGSKSLRTFNRNFKGRCGTADAKVYLGSPETAAATALTGVLTDPRDLGVAPKVTIQRSIVVNDSMIIPPLEKRENIKVRMGPNIKPLPLNTPLPNLLKCKILIKIGDDVTTDDIIPAGPKILPLRSNIPALANHVFSQLFPGFAEKARRFGGGFIVGGENYGQGSSREHAALAPMYLGIKCVFAVSFARIHRSNLINFGVPPLLITRNDYKNMQEGDRLIMDDIRTGVRDSSSLRVKDIDNPYSFDARLDISVRERNVLLAGGLLNYMKMKLGRENEN